MANKTTRRTSAVVTRNARPDSAGVNLDSPPSGDSSGRANWQFDLNAATKAGASLEILRVRFLEVHGGTSNRAFSELPVEVRAEISLTDPLVTTKDNLVSIVTEFAYALKSSTLDSLAPVADVRALTELLYSKNPESDLTPDDLTAFATVNAPFNAWPYWRELTQSILTRLGLPALPLPLFRISDLPGLLRKGY